MVRLTVTPRLLERMASRLERIEDELIALRRDIHMHPELSGEEERTAAIVAKRLGALGFSVREGVGGYGVVAVVEGATPGPVVAYRADMDAMPSEAPDPVPFRSETPGVRHICGHDVHVAVGLGLAEALAEARDDLRGTVKLIFQPAEENAEGAMAMLNDGAFSDPTPQAIFAVHSAPLPVGTIGSTEGLFLPGLTTLDVTLRGDNLKTAAEAYAAVIASVTTVAPPTNEMTLAQLPSINDPSGAVAAGVVKSEQAAPDQPLRLQAMMRATNRSAFERAKVAIEAGVRDTVFDNVTVDLAFNEYVIPDVVNDATLVRAALDPMRAALGPDAIIELDWTSPYNSEDFAFFLQHAPGAMYWLGVSNPELGTVGLPHSPDFVADEQAIVVGANAMAVAVVNYLDTN